MKFKAEWGQVLGYAAAAGVSEQAIKAAAKKVAVSVLKGISTTGAAIGLSYAAIAIALIKVYTKQLSNLWAQRARCEAASLQQALEIALDTGEERVSPSQIDSPANEDCWVTGAKGDRMPGRMSWRSYPGGKTVRRNVLENTTGPTWLGPGTAEPTIPIYWWAGPWGVQWDTYLRTMGAPTLDGKAPEVSAILLGVAETLQEETPPAVSKRAELALAWIAQIEKNKKGKGWWFFQGQTFTADEDALERLKTYLGELAMANAVALPKAGPVKKDQPKAQGPAPLGELGNVAKTPPADTITVSKKDLLAVLEQVLRAGITYGRLTSGG